MRFLHDYIKKIKPLFEKGAKYGRFHSTFEAFETFLFVPDKVTCEGCHVKDSLDMKRTMSIVVLALVPCLLFGMWNTGYQHYLAVGAVYDHTVFFIDAFLYGLKKVLPMLLVSYVVGLSIEFVFAEIRGHEVNEGFLVTGMLIPLVMPADLPLWMLALATAFSVVIGKEVFGGTGMNFVNPALLARAFVFFAYPAYMSGDKVWVSGLREGAGILDGYSGETVLAQAAAGKSVFLNGIGGEYSFYDMFLGFIPGSVGETSTLAILIGAAILIITGIGSFRIMVSVFAGGWIMALLLNTFAINSYMAMPPHYHMVLGGFAFGAVFMATDPVTAAQTNTGKIIYGLLIGLLAILIRVLNPAFPEGMMLAILLMNVFAPLIDHYVVEANIRARKKRVK